MMRFQKLRGKTCREKAVITKKQSRISLLEDIDREKVSVLFVYQAEESMTVKKTFEKHTSIYSKNDIPDL